MPGYKDYYDTPDDQAAPVPDLYSAPTPGSGPRDLVAPDRQRIVYTMPEGGNLTEAAADVANDPSAASRIAARNGIANPSRVQAGRQVVITPADVGSLPPGGGAVVQRGDTATAIAARLGVSVGDLAAANPQIADLDRLYPSQRLNLPSSPSTTPPATATDTSSAATPSTQTPAGPPQSTAGQDRRQSNLDQRPMAASNVQDRKEVRNQDGSYYLADRPLAEQPKGLGFDADGWIRHVRDSLGNGLGGLVNVSDNGPGPQPATGEPASVPQADVDAGRAAYQATFSGEHARAGERELAAEPLVPDVLGGVRQGVQDIAQGVQNRDVLGTLGGAAQVLGAAGVALPGTLGAESLVARGAKAAEAADTAARGALPKAGDLADTAQAGAESARAPEVRPEAPPAEPVASPEPSPPAATPEPAVSPEAATSAAPTAPANTAMLETSPGPGRVPLSPGEVDDHLENLQDSYSRNDERIADLETRLSRPAGASIDRPGWARGKSDQELIGIADAAGVNPYEPLWDQKANLHPGTGEYQRAVLESGARGVGSSRFTGQTSNPTLMRAELKSLRAQQDGILQAVDAIDQAGPDVTFYRAQQQPETELPFDAGANSPASSPADAAAAAHPADSAEAPGGASAESPVRGAASGERSPGSAATAGAPATFEQKLDALQARPEYQDARPIQQVQFVQALAEGRLPDDMLAPAAAGRPRSDAELAAIRHYYDAQGAQAADADLYRPTELAAGLTPRAVADSGARVFAPATLAPQPVQDALNTFDSQVRGAAARIDTLVGRQQLAQDAGDKLYATTKATGYGQFLKDVAASPDGVMPKGAGVSRPAGWMDGSALGAPLDRVYVSPDVATVVGNIRDQVNGNTLADTLGAVNKGFGVVKEATLGGSVYHLGQEAMQAARLTRENAPAVLGSSIANAVDPTGTLYQRFRSTWAPWFERASDAGVTQLSRTPEGELVDLMRGPKGLALRTGTGAVAGAIKGGLGASPDQDRFTEALKGAGLGAAFGAFGSYMIPALWERAIPTMKVSAFRTLVDRGLSDQAAAQSVENVLGGQNLVRIARSPVVSAAMRATWYAPSWWESWGRTVFRAINPADWSEVGKEAKAYTAATLVSGAVAVEGLNRLFAGHSALENDPGHLADVDMTRQWGADPKTGGRQYVNFLGPVADILNAVNDPGGFLTRRLGYLPNLASEASTGKTLSGYPVPNVQVELQGGKPYTPTDTLQQRALAVAAQQIENAYPAGASSAQRMYEAGGLPAAAVSVLTGARESSYRPPRAALPPKYIGVNDPIQQQRIDDAIKKVNAWERDPRSPRPTATDRQLDNRYGGNLSPAYSRALDITRGLAPRPQAPQAPQRDLSRAPEPAGSR